MMLTCSACGATHPPNTLFCDECGNRLLEAPPPGTMPGDAVRLSLFSGDGARQFECVLSGVLVVGRQDASVKDAPGIDLNALNGAHQGVSRRHARFMRGAGRILLEDLNSLNGTFVSGRRLPAHLPSEVHSGDELQFGQIVLRLQIEPA